MAHSSASDLNEKISLHNRLYNAFYQETMAELQTRDPSIQPDSGDVNWGRPHSVFFLERGIPREIDLSQSDLMEKVRKYLQASTVPEIELMAKTNGTAYAKSDYYKTRLTQSLY